MGRLSIVNTPLLAGNAVEQAGVVHLRLIEGERLLESTLRNTITVTQFHLYGIGTALRIRPTGIVEC